MGGLAQIAKSAGHRVTGSDRQVYPPMSTQLQQAGIEFTEGFDAVQLDIDVDQVVVGNVMTRGMPVVERMLAERMRYNSAPQWLYETVLSERRVLAVAGTHGKTTTASMLAWILEYAGLNPGFLIGGVPENFGVSARLGESPFFVIEADEYDTAFFDKRSKFVHYHPEVLVINNMEFDHADIFSDLAAIQRQFHHLIRMVPGNGLIIHPSPAPAIDEVIQQGCWTPLQTIAAETGGDWEVRALSPDHSVLEIIYGGSSVGRLDWSSIGKHNAMNALAAIAAAHHAGVFPAQSIAALAVFKGVKRRMQLRGDIGGVKVYDDFAHHPTAIATTLEGLRANVGDGRIIAVFEPRSNSMRSGAHTAGLAESFSAANELLLHQPEDLVWNPEKLHWPLPVSVTQTIPDLLEQLLRRVRAGDHVLIMSNGGFGGLHDKLLQALKQGIQHD